MTVRPDSRLPASYVYEVRPRRAPATELFVAWLFIGSALLIIPSIWLRALIVVAWGPLIFAREKQLGLPVPATPGTMLWLGSTLSYVIGGLGTILLYGPWHDPALRYLDSALLYLGLGLGAYALGLWLVGQQAGSLPRGRKAASGLSFSLTSILLITGLFILPVLGRGAVSSDKLAAVYYNLLVGALQSIEQVPMVLFAIYLRQPASRWWAGLLLISASLAVPLESILIGYGRNKLPFALVSLAFTWLALVWYAEQRVSRHSKVIIVLLPLVLTLFFGMNTAYRNEIRYDRSLTIEQRLLVAHESVNGIAASGNIVVDSAGMLVSRLIELPSLELLGRAESGEIRLAGWTLGDFKQVLLSWVPRVFYPEKGVGYGRDIMEYYGLCSPWNNVPVTILSDAYRRLGVVGVLGLYLFMGVVSTVIALKLSSHWGAIGLVFAFFFALQHLQIYSGDVLSVFLLYIYRLPSSAIAIYALLRLARIWQPHRKVRSA